MNTEEQRRLAADWLVQEGNGLWTWDAAAQVLLWKDGRTVAFREELILILENLPGPYVPDAPALVLILAACRGLLPDAEALELMLPPEQGEFRQSVARVSLEIGGRLEEISVLPEAHRRGPASKANLLSLIPCNLLSTSKAAVLSFLSEGLPLEAWPRTPARRAHLFWSPALSALKDALANLQPEAIETLMRTGLEELPRAAGVELPIGERVRQLLKELEQDEEFSAIAALTREIMAALVMPRALPRLDFETPGGFADIGNRGALHRLLISELAHDDDTLAARIALNEALYLRREPASQTPPSTLAVVLDSGVRMWGTPRVLASAVALAALAKRDAYAESATFRATVGGVVPIELGSREGLASHLEALETPIHPAAAVMALAQECRGRPGKLDVLLITHPNCLEEPALISALASLPEGACHAATVDREGRFNLQLRTPSAWSPLAAALLNFESLFAKPSTTKRLSQGATPAFYYGREVPLLLPLNTKFRSVIPLKEEGFVGYSVDGDLWYWRSISEGARRLRTPRMRGSFCGLLYSSLGNFTTAITYEAGQRSLNIVSWRRSESDQETINVSTVPQFPAPPEKVWVDGAFVNIGTASEVFALSSDTGEIHARSAIPTGGQWIGRRFLAVYERGNKKFLLPLFVGQGIDFLPLDQAFLQSPHVPLQLFEPDDDAQIVVLLNDGRFVLADSGQVVLSTPFKQPPPMRFFADGYRVLIDFGQRNTLLVDLKAKTKTTHFEYFTDTGLPHPLPRRWTVRTKFTHVAFAETGHVRLRAQKGYWMEIRKPSGRDCLCLERISRAAPGLQHHPFGDGEERPELGLSIALAKGTEGSRVWLDTHGFLHFQSADSTIPEVTILLAESNSLPAWSSDGLKIGPAYFTGDAKTHPGHAAQIETYLQRFVAATR